MARKAKGKPLTLRPLRLDDDVWAELQKMKATGTINEGLRAVLFKGQPRFGDDLTKPTDDGTTTISKGALEAQRLKEQEAVAAALSFKPPAHLDAQQLRRLGQGKASVETYQRPFKGPLLRPGEKGKQ